MATRYQTPGVYITEPDAFPQGVVGVATAQPVFVGYTETAIDPVTHKDLTAPVNIASMVEYTEYFGGPHAPVFVVTPTLSSTLALTAKHDPARRHGHPWRLRPDARGTSGRAPTASACIGR